MEEKVKREQFTMIPNKALEHLAKVKLSPNESRTVMALNRKTYGFQKDEDRISISQFQDMTRLERKRQIEALKSLVKKRIILKETGSINSYALNENYAEWVVAGPPPARTPAEEDRLVALRSKLVASEGQLPVAGPPHTIDNTIDILQKKECAKNPDRIDLSLAIARAIGMTDGNNIAFTSSSNAMPTRKRLRTIEEIRVDHPEVIKIHVAKAGGKCCALWLDPSKKGGRALEECA